MISKIWRKIVTKYITKKSNNYKNKLIKKNLYIFPNIKGFQLGAFIFFSFSASIFYQNNVGLLLSIVIFIIYFISIMISYQNLSNIEIKPLTYLVPKNKNIYLDFLIQTLNERERLNLDINIENQPIKNINLKERKKIFFKSYFFKRGINEIPVVRLQSLFPFGIIKTFGVIKFSEKIYVYPEPIKPPYSLIQSLKVKNKLDEDDYEFDKIEETKPGENLSKISWRHYSIKKKLFSKKFIYHTSSKKVLIDIEDFSNTNLELALSHTVYLIEHYYKQKISFAIKYRDFISKYSNSLKHKNDLLKFTANV